MSFHEGSNWQARKEDEGKPLYSNPQPAPLPEQGKEEDLVDIIKKHCTSRDGFNYTFSTIGIMLAAKEIEALKSRPSEGWSDTQLKDFGEYCDNHEGSMENLLKQWKNKQVTK